MKLNLTQTQRNNYLRTFWFVLALAMMAGAVALFEARNASRDKAISKQALAVLSTTIEEHPEAEVALQALMVCIRKGSLKINNRTDENELNQPKEQCPAYRDALEATYASPLALHELSEGYRKLIMGLKAV